MILKVNGLYITVDVDIERQSKVFNAFSETSGDYSYQFEIPNTSEIRKALGVPATNQLSKPIYQNIDAEILTDDGISLHIGTLKIESAYTVINASFFSGNSNWIKEITGSILDFDYSEFDVERNDAAVMSTWSQSNVGTIFPLVDRGNLETRIGGAWANDTDDLNKYAFDFHPFFFVKTIVKKIFNEINVKLEGDLIKDPLFQNMIITSNRNEARQSRVEDRTSKIGRTSSQTINTSATKLQLSEISDGANNLYNPVTFKYTADASFRASFQVFFQLDVAQVYTLEIYKNGASVISFNVDKSYSGSIAGVYLNAGDYLEFYLTSASSSANLLTGSEITIKPTRFSTIYISDYLPSLDKSELISNLFKQFNIVSSYNTYTRTVNTKYFQNVKNSSIDLSDYVTSYKTDYFEFINDFSQKNNLVYQQAPVADTYNKGNTVQSGNGVIEISNQYLKKSGTLAEVSFSAPVTTINAGIAAPLINLGYLDYHRMSDTEFEITSVTDNGSGMARFNVPGAMPIGIAVGRVVEIYNVNTLGSYYEGTGVISVSTGSYFELSGVRYISTATAKFNLVIYDDVPDDSAIIAVVAFADVGDFSPVSQLYIESTPVSTNIPYAYFDKPRTGRSIDSLVYSLAFDPVNQTGSYQIGLIERCYSDLRKLLNDPLKIYAQCNIPAHIYNQITMLEAVRLQVNEFNALFYINRITSYKSSSLPCTVELIKLT